MKKLLFVLSAIVSMQSALLAQDPILSQPYANPLTLNPAFAGTADGQRMGANFRDDWANYNGAYFTTYNISYDRNVIDSDYGIGGAANIEGSGGYYTYHNYLFAISRQIHIKSFTLSIGASYEYNQFTTHWAEIPGFISNTTETNNTFSGGILGYGKYYFAGVSLYNTTPPFENTQLNYYKVNAGLMIPAGDLIVSPTISFQERYYNTEIMELFIAESHVTVAGGYEINQSQNSLIFTAGYHNNYIRAAITGDFYIATDMAQAATALELSVAYMVHYKNDCFKKKVAFNGPMF